MKVWIETWKVQPPADCTISGRFGASIMFVGYSKILDRWVWLQPGGIEEKIAEPEKIFLDEEYIRAHPRIGGAPRENKTRIHRRKADQLRLDL